MYTIRYGFDALNFVTTALKFQSVYGVARFVRHVNRICLRITISCNFYLFPKKTGAIGMKLNRGKKFVAHLIKWISRKNFQIIFPPIDHRILGLRATLSTHLSSIVVPIKIPRARLTRTYRSRINNVENKYSRL